MSAAASACEVCDIVSQWISHDVVWNMILPLTFDFHGEYVRAAASGDIETIKLFDPRVDSGTKGNALLAAAKRGHCDIVRHLVPICGYRRSRSCIEAVQEAAANGQIEVLKYLTGLKISAAANRNKALHLAINNGYEAAVRHLVRCPNVRVLPAMFSAALLRGHFDICRALLEIGGPTAETNLMNGMVLDAYTENYSERLRFVLSVAQNFTVEHCKMLLKIAVDYNIELVKKALSLPNVRLDKTVFNSCVHCNQLDIVRALCEWRDIQGQLPKLPVEFLKSSLGRFSWDHSYHKRIYYLLSLYDDNGNYRFDIECKKREIIVYICSMQHIPFFPTVLEKLLKLRRRNKPIFDRSDILAGLEKALERASEDAVKLLVIYPEIDLATLKSVLTHMYPHNNYYINNWYKCRVIIAGEIARRKRIVEDIVHPKPPTTADWLREYVKTI